MRYRIEGTYTRGGARGPFVIEAASAEAAREEAAKVGILVSAVVPLPEPDDAAAARSAPPRASAVTCKSCTEPPLGACKVCGGFYCARHGGLSSYGPFCSACYDGRRPVFGIAALLEIGLGVFCLLVAGAPRVEGGGVVLFGLLALGAFGLALFCGWCALRSFPSADRPGTQG